MFIVHSIMYAKIVAHKHTVIATCIVSTFRDFCREEAGLEKKLRNGNQININNKKKLKYNKILSYNVKIMSVLKYSSEVSGYCK